MTSKNIIQLLGSEKYRIETALKIVKTNKQATEILNMNERTYFRKLKKYKLKSLRQREK
jgi:DNA-binding NtrC family response regulator